ncbi:hypothetical protein QBC34DRAFT_416751 [Podospora aff. communis PSN243]|uniref:NmrA-like domain-containing protein n=1 Tax=Podospora aff. communis PSN243 TaxID=3040156 RepID=A0AAV9G822_9PEZI|nr:hypothetical protein QBC34DRAFT_416751 [Podospora aff. communis PSN243]
MAAKIVTVVGATGAQGKGVVAAFLNNPAYKVRAITRNTTSAAAKALVASGAEVVQADLESPASLKAAFAGSSIIFAVTNFFEPFAAHQSPVKGMEVEVQQGINLANAAAAVPTLEHYIWSTLPNGMAISNGKYLVPHFEGKNRIDAYIRSLPALLEKTTFLWITWYHINYTFPMFTPYFIPTAGKHIQFANYSPETPINTIGNVSVNITPFVQAIVAQPEKTKQGAIVLGATEENIPAGEMLQTWARVKGVQAQQVRVDNAAFYAIWPLWAEEMGVMMEFWDEYKEKSWTEAGKEIVTAKDLGIEGQFQSLEEAYKTLEI